MAQLVLRGRVWLPGGDVKKNYLALLLAGLLAGPTVLNATPVSWLFSGNVTVAGGSDLPPAIHVGDPFSAILHFDTSTPLNAGAFNQANCLANNGGAGSICRLFGAPLSSQYWSDVTVNGINYGMIPNLGPLAQTSNLITVRNNAPDPDNPADTIDGYAFDTDQCLGKCGVGDPDMGAGVFIRSLDLTLVTDARLLPENPSPLMNTARTRFFQACVGTVAADLSNSCEFADVEGVFNSVSRVPEPATLALLGIGVAGLAASRRRKLN